MDNDGLTDKQRRFCNEYLIDWNATQAAIRAGYSEKTAQMIGSENLSKPIIQAYIEIAKDKIEERLGLSKDKILKEHAKLAFSNIARLHDTWITRKEFETLPDDEKSCIAEIVTQIRTEWEGRGPNKTAYEVEYVKIKLYDKQKALDSISKIMGYDAPSKSVVENYNNGPLDVLVHHTGISPATSEKEVLDRENEV
jgi:phage terminase small subunit